MSFFFQGAGSKDPPPPLGGLNSQQFCLVLLNTIARSSRNDRIYSRAFLILYEQPNQHCKIDFATCQKITANRGLNRSFHARYVRKKK